MGVGGAFRLVAPGLIIAAGLLPAGCAAPAPIPVQPPVRVAARPVAPRSVASKPVASPPAAENLLGTDSAKLETWLGKPRLIRHDDPAQVWQYRNNSCVLDVYLYPAEDELKVAHAEARTQAITASPVSACLAAFFEERRKVTGG